jgi:hypothetical protein
MRYAFPAGLIGTLVVSLAFAALRWEAAASALPQRWLRALDAVLLATATYLVATTGFRPLKQLVLQNAGRSQTFDNAIEAAAAKLRAEPTRPLLFSASAPDNDLEPLVSIRIYLQYYGVENPMFLSLPPEAGGRMAERMHSWSAQGLVDWQEDEGLHGVPGPHGKFLPMGELSAWGKPFGIAISAPLPPGVEPIGMAW